MRIRHLLLMVAMVAISATASAQTTGEKIKAFADKHLRLSGYLQGGFRWDEQAGSTFYLHRARVAITGDFLKEKFDYRLQVDFAGSPKITDLYVRYKPFNALNVQLGQFKLPFTVENEQYGPTTVEFIDYSYVTTYIARNNAMYDGIAATGRDIGLQLYGGFIERDGYSIINYNLALINGSGINRKDDDKSKELVARLIFKPIKGLSVGGAYMAILGKDRIISDSRIADSPRWAVTAIYDLNQYVARAEFAQADFAGVTTNAFYAMFGYRFTNQWSLAGRYEFVEDEFKFLDEDRITAGVAYKPFNFLRLQFDASYVIDNRLNAKNYMGCNLLVTAMF